MTQMLFIALGGAIGSVVRYLVSVGIYNLVGRSFPYGTLVVNVTGCLLIGFFATFLLDRFNESTYLRNFLLIGVLGGYTTFSSFAYETFSLIQEQAVLAVCLNILLSLLLSILCVILGFVLAKSV